MTSDQMTTTYIHFEGLSVADANRAAAELRSMLDRAGDGVQVQITKDRDDTQDLGATLVLVLGTKAALTVAKVIYAYVAKRGDRVVIETTDGKVLATGSGAANIDVSKTVEALRSQLHE